MLDMMRKFPAEGSSYLSKTEFVNSQEVKEFFKPVYSSSTTEKEDEEIIVYNFHQFLKKLDRTYCFENPIKRKFCYHSYAKCVQMSNEEAYNYIKVGPFWLLNSMFFLCWLYSGCCGSSYWPGKMHQFVKNTYMYM
jgi:hypothetical protein